MTTVEEVERSHGHVSTGRSAAGAVLLFVGTVASFKCLGDLKRPLLEGLQGQHSIAGNIAGWLLFGLLPIAGSLYLWRHRRGDPGPGTRASANLPAAALGSALFAIGLHSLLARTAANARPDDLWYGLLVPMPLSTCAVLAAVVSLVLAMIVLSRAGRTRPMEIAAVVASGMSVLVTAP